MAAIALAESGGRPEALNPTDNHGTQSSFGLWQISNGTHTPPNAKWADPNVNAQLAVAKQKSQGLTAWGTYTSGTAQRILTANGGAGTALTATVVPGTGGALPMIVPGQAGPKDTEGSIVMPSVIPNISRTLIRRTVGAAVLAAGAGIGLVALFLRAKIPVPNPVSAAQGLVTQRREGRHEEATVMMRARQQQQATRERALQASRDQVGEKRRERQQRAEQQSRRARDEGRRAAEEAGPFE
jgi:hypothetical protein